MKNWLGRLSEGTATAYAYNFKDFMSYLREDSKFNGLSPDELVKYQKNAEKTDGYDVLDAAQRWVLSREGMRRGSKANLLKAVRSFFEHNRASLPMDKSFKIRGDRPQVPTLLTLNEVKAVALASTKMYRSVFLTMLGGGLDQAGLVYWSDNGWLELGPQLDRGEKIVTVTIPGRKGTKFSTTFSTYIYGDALDALKTWVSERGSEAGPIFTTQQGFPLTKNSLNDYWVRKLKDLGYITPIKKGGGRGKSNERYGRGIHNLRDLFRSQWSKSGASPQVAESMMGHIVDKYGYDQSFKDEKYVKAQVTKAAPFMCIMSSGTPFHLVSEERVLELEEQVQKLQTAKDDRMEAIEAKMKEYTAALELLYKDPEMAAKLKKAT